MIENNSVIKRAKPENERKIFRAPIKSINRIPEEILHDPLLNIACGALPTNYNFEVHKTIWRIRHGCFKRVALQMPEGLLMFATTLCDIIEKFTEADTVIMGDVTYGACCVDDFTAKALGVELLIHYGHSCLIPIDQTTGIKMLYIFVDIKIDPEHFLETLKFNFPTTTKLAFVSTIQFISTLHAIGAELKQLGYSVEIPQSKPLSSGEILGCTAPKLKNADAIIYLGDGRFHLEAAMISNPKTVAYRYDPYEKKLTKEFYDHNIMLTNRKRQIDNAKVASKFGLIMGTLGRQGNPKVMHYIQKTLDSLSKKYVVILLSEIFPGKLDLFPDIDAFIQVACPRLSIDWGTFFKKPLLTPYEFAVMIGEATWNGADSEDAYPMDFYSNTSLGAWAPNFKPIKNEKCCAEDSKPCTNAVT